MDREIHFEKMRETSHVVIPLIKDAFSKTEFRNIRLFKALNYFVNIRTIEGQCLLRPYLVRLGFELAGKKNWMDIAYACAALEVFNISTYQSNIAFDGKNGIISNFEKNNQFISSMISFNLSVDTIIKLRKTYPQKIVSRIIERLHETNRDVYIGQFFDFNQFSFGHFNFSMSEDEYLSLYSERCEKLGGSLTSLCLEIGYLLGDGDNYLFNTLRKIGIMLGTAGQLVNDISDFVPNGRKEQEIKRYKSQFSDFKAGKITYPIFHLLNNSSVELKKKVIIALEKKKANESFMEEITGNLCRHGSIKSAKKIVLSYYKNLKKEIHKFPKSQSRDLLSLAFSSLLTNKYFAMLKRFPRKDNV